MARRNRLINHNTEIVQLASEGFFYPSDSILASGIVEMLPLTAEDEDILGNKNLAKYGLILPRILSKILPNVTDIDSILQCDVETILLNSRILNYGAMITLNLTCANCDTKFNSDTSFAFRAAPFAFHGLTRGKNSIKFQFPVCKKMVEFKLPTWKEHLSWNQIGWVEFAKRITLSIDGEDDIENFYENILRAMDSKAFREFYQKQTPGFITTWTIKCPNCGNVTTSNVDIETDIFNIKPQSIRLIHSEIFNLCYHTNGAFTYGEVYKMPITKRAFYIRKLIDLKNEDNERTKKQEAEVKSMSKQPAKPSSAKPSVPSRKR